MGVLQELAEMGKNARAEEREMGDGAEERETGKTGKNARAGENARRGRRGRTRDGDGAEERETGKTGEERETGTGRKNARRGRRGRTRERGRRCGGKRGNFEKLKAEIGVGVLTAKFAKEREGRKKIFGLGLLTTNPR
jgi:hypothetical protein